MTDKRLPTTGELMAAAQSGKPIIINGQKYEVSMEIAGELRKKDGTVIPFTERKED
jgi:hypothetical protein